MKKLWLIFLLLGILSGCAFFQQQKANWEACKADAACSAQAKVWQGRGEIGGESIATGVATFVPGVAPAIVPAGKVVGYIVFALAMLIGGHGLTKKQIVTPPPVVPSVVA